MVKRYIGNMNLFKGLLGAGLGFLTGGPAGAAVGGLGALTSSDKNKNLANQSAAQAQQSQGQLQQLAGLLQQRYQNAAPQEQAVLNYFLQRAGLAAGGNAPGGNLGGGTIPGSVFGGALGAPVTHAPMGTAPGLNGGQPFAAYGSRKTLPGFQQTQAVGTPIGGQGQPGLIAGSLGIYNSPEYQLLRQQAEEDVNRNAVSTAHQYNNSLIARGLQNSSLATGGQAAITAGANKTYSDFVRQLAMGAADKQDALANQALGSLGGALGSAGQAGNLLSSAGGLGQAGQQLNQNQQNTENSALGSAIGAAAKYWALGKTPIGSIGGIGDYNASNDHPAPGAGPVNGPPIPHDAQGGYAPASQPVIVGDGSTPGHTGELFVPTGGKAEKPHTTAIPTSMLHAIIGHLIERSQGQTVGQAGPIQAGQGQGPELLASTSMTPAEEDALRAHLNLPPRDTRSAAEQYRAATQRWHQIMHGPPPPPQDGYWSDPQDVRDLLDSAPVGMGYEHDPATQAGIQAYYDRLARAAYQVTVGGPDYVPTHSLPARAQGGPVAAAQPYIVGEHGPEIMVPHQNGVILPNPADGPGHPIALYLQALQQMKGY
jgi:hypothetical protein